MSSNSSAPTSQSQSQATDSSSSTSSSGSGPGGSEGEPGGEEKKGYAHQAQEYMQKYGMYGVAIHYAVAIGSIIPIYRTLRSSEVDMV